MAKYYITEHGAKIYPKRPPLSQPFAFTSDDRGALIEAARRRFADNSTLNEIAIVKVVAIVRRAAPPIEVIEVAD
jgi:hypothetical protein